MAQLGGLGGLEVFHLGGFGNGLGGVPLSLGWLVWCENGLGGVPLNL